MSYELTAENIAIEFGNDSAYGSRQAALKLKIDEILLQNRIDTFKEVIEFMRPYYDGFWSRDRKGQAATAFKDIIDSIEDTVKKEEIEKQNLGTVRTLQKKVAGIDPEATEALVTEAWATASQASDMELVDVTHRLIIALLTRTGDLERLTETVGDFMQRYFNDMGLEFDPK